MGHTGKEPECPDTSTARGATRDRIKVYNNSWYFNAKTIDEFVERAGAAVAQGFRALKWNLLESPAGYLQRT